MARAVLPAALLIAIAGCEPDNGAAPDQLEDEEVVPDADPDLPDPDPEDPDTGLDDDTDAGTEY